MASQTIFQVRHDTFPALGEQDKERAVVNRFASQIQVDFVTQLILGGYAYHMQVGTEITGVETGAALDDQLAFMLADNTAGYCMMPLLYEATPGPIETATILQAALTVDRLIARYDSGGAAYVPANLRGDDPKVAVGDFYIQSTDLIPAAQSSGADCIELARRDFTEDALDPTIGYPGAWRTQVYSINERPPCAIIGVGSIVCQFGAASDQPLSYGALQFAQFDKNLVV